MKAGLIIAVLAVLMTLGSCAHLRSYNENHELFDFGSMNPLQIASLLSGDWTAILPASIQPFVRTLFQKEQQSGVAGFLNKAQSFMGGNGGGLFGGMGNLFGQASQTGQQSGLSGLLNNFGGALGGSGLSPASLGLPTNINIPGFGSQSGLSGLSGLTGGNTGGLLNGLSNLMK